MQPTDRRSFLVQAGALAGVAAMGTSSVSARSRRSPGRSSKGPVSIASANGLGAVERAYERMLAGVDPAVAVVEGVGLVEADPDDMSVGLGGLPNEDCIVELDASVMHGPTHKAGAVAALRDTVHAAAVALKVLQTTDHVMIVGEGARRFARQHGFPAQDLLTDKARQAWLNWKNQLNEGDDWLNEDQRDWELDGSMPRTTGTIHCSAVTAAGDLGSCTTTSGLSYKIPGRVGDSPIIGAGMFCDNEVGAAGATGRGEAVIQSCGAHSMVGLMADGMHPTDACLEVAKTIARRSKLQRRLVDEEGRPRFDVKLYALRKDGKFGSASIWSGASFAVADAQGARIESSAFVFERA